MPERYDSIGRNYAEHRHTEPTWHAAIAEALGPAERILNVGAGTGNYEEHDTQVVALEPSMIMIAQRSQGSAPVVRGIAEALPFADDSFDAVMGVLTMHHWADQQAGLLEAARVAERQVFTVYEPSMAHTFWLVDYFPETTTTKMELEAPTPADIDRHLDVLDVRVLWIPRDCREGFGAASWARPHDYLDPAKQDAISFLAMADAAVRARGTERLRHDLASGAWHARYGHVAEQERADFGYRLVTSCRR